MENELDQIHLALEDLAGQVVMLDGGDIPALGKLLNALNTFASELTDALPELFQQLVSGLITYTEALVLFDVDDLEPLADGVTVLQNILRGLSRGESYDRDESVLLGVLNPKTAAEPDTGQQDEPPAESAAGEEPLAPAADDTQAQPPLGEEDIAILSDFVMESRENLDTIEVNLIDLEHTPDDKEIINAIFRPFHTIKGVSGFLNLSRINKLAHSTENLLDGARQGEFQINDDITDLILSSVDTLKQLIENVERRMSEGALPLEGDIDVSPLLARIQETGRRAASGEEKRLGDILQEKSGISKDILEQGLAIQKADPQRRIGEILVDEKLVESKAVLSALREQRQQKRVFDQQVKVDTAKLDNLVDQTGELVIAQAMIRQHQRIRSTKDQKLSQNLNQLTQIVSLIQKIAMSMRMVPVRSTFQRMVRLVRDLARSSGKEVGLEMSGEDTEIDRNVVEQLYEPMVHMIRNAVDHGLESPEQRQAAGKPAQGKIRLSAFHQGGNIVIEIADDGRGLDRARILEKALKTGLVSPDEQLPEDEIHNMIFHPGFSTAGQITDVSGRGVGMDVVKKGIERLRGRLDIRSAPGNGTTFVINLPLTLAIIDGMIVRVGGERYILPALSIIESFRPVKNECHSVKGKGEMVEARGRLMPLIRLDRVFATAQSATPAWEALVIVVEHKNAYRALLVDELLGKEEVVIKSLGSGLQHVKGLTGGAILGDGRVGLILDIEGLFNLADEQ